MAGEHTTRLRCVGTSGADYIIMYTMLRVRKNISFYFSIESLSFVYSWHTHCKHHSFLLIIARLEAFRFTAGGYNYYPLHRSPGKVLTHFDLGISERTATLDLNLSCTMRIIITIYIYICAVRESWSLLTDWLHSVHSDYRRLRRSIQFREHVSGFFYA